LKNKSVKSARGLTFWTLALLMSAITTCSLANELRFEQAFSEKGESNSLHFTAQFLSRGTSHQLELWRDKGRRLKRTTDDAIEVYAFRKPGDAEYHMSILDLKKKIHTRVDRTNLYRIGNFTDWFDLAHGLKHPAGNYHLTSEEAPGNALKAIASCKWYSLTQDAPANSTHICWSEASRIPLLIQDQNGTVVWKVLAVDQKPVSAKTFEIHDEGFVRNDANQDIDPD